MLQWLLCSPLRMIPVLWSTRGTSTQWRKSSTRLVFSFQPLLFSSLLFSLFSFFFFLGLLALWCWTLLFLCPDQKRKPDAKAHWAAWRGQDWLPQVGGAAREHSDSTCYQAIHQGGGQGSLQEMSALPVDPLCLFFPSLPPSLSAFFRILLSFFPSLLSFLSSFERDL